MDELCERLNEALSDRYEIGRAIGEGGMATVFRARELHPPRQVAVKVLKPDVSSLITRTRFLREIDLAGRLVHPHILPVFGAGEVGELLYFVMPFIEGDSLRQLLTRRRSLPVVEALAIAAEAAEALQFAHNNGIIHRDVKPENILLSHGHALVADFGIAKAFKDANELQLTQSGVALGTPAYMSPEQARGTQMGPASDIYSLGCVLYEMLTGSPPYVGGPREVMKHHSTSRMPPIRSRRGVIPEPVVAAVRRAMSKEPERRFSSAGEFAAALREAASSVPRHPKRRLGAGAGFTAGTAAVLLVGTLLWRVFGGPAVEQVFVAPFDNRTGRAEFDSVGAAIGRAVAELIPAEFAPGRIESPEFGGAVGSSAGETKQEGATLVHGSFFLQADSLQFLVLVTDVASGTVLAALDPVVVGLEDYRAAIAPLAAGVSSLLQAGN